MIKLLVLLSVCASALSLRCYDCGPNDAGCADPANNNIKESDCAANEVCFTMEFNAYENTPQQSGLYKGCGRKAANCKYELEVGAEGQVVSCQTCEIDRCNGAASLAVSVLAVLIGVIFYSF